MLQSTKSTLGNTVCATLLERKFGMRPNMNAIVINPPETLLAEIDGDPIPSIAELPKAGVFDFIHLFVTSKEGLEDKLRQLSTNLSDIGMLWVSFPKWKSLLYTDLKADDVRAMALPLGLVDMKTRNIDTEWSAIKLVAHKYNSSS